MTGAILSFLYHHPRTVLLTTAGLVALAAMSLFS